MYIQQLPETFHDLGIYVDLKNYSPNHQQLLLNMFGSELNKAKIVPDDRLFALIRPIPITERGKLNIRDCLNCDLNENVRGDLPVRFPTKGDAFLGCSGILCRERLLEIVVLNSDENPPVDSLTANSFALVRLHPWTIEHKSDDFRECLSIKTFQYSASQTATLDTYATKLFQFPCGLSIDALSAQSDF